MIRRLVTVVTGNQGGSIAVWPKKRPHGHSGKWILQVRVVSTQVPRFLISRYGQMTGWTPLFGQIVVSYTPRCAGGERRIHTQDTTIYSWCIGVAPNADVEHLLTRLLRSDLPILLKSKFLKHFCHFDESGHFCLHRHQRPRLSPHGIDTCSLITRIVWLVFIPSTLPNPRRASPPDAAMHPATRYLVPQPCCGVQYSLPAMRLQAPYDRMT